MNVKKLSNGLVVPNYKKLCELLGICVKAGDSKNAQLKELERFCKFSRNKNSFIIEEVYEKELPKNSNLTQYIPLIEKLILHTIVSKADENKEDNRIYIKKNDLLRTLSMINSKYTEYKYSQIRLSKEIKVSKESIFDFYSSTSSMLERNLETALKNLQNQSLILWNNVYTVDKIEIKNDNSSSSVIVSNKKQDYYGDFYDEFSEVKRVYHNHVEATKQETENILVEQNLLLKKMDLKDIDEVYKTGKNVEFFTEIKRILLEKYNISNYYFSYSLIFNMEHIVKQYLKLSMFINEFTLNSDVVYELNTELNQNIVDKTYKLAENRHNKSIENTKNTQTNFLRIDKTEISEKDRVRRRPSYVNDSKKITDTLIKIEENK